MSILHQWLENRKLKYEDLSAEEKKDYDYYSQVLNAPEVTIEDLRAFLPKQIERLENEQNDYQNSRDKDLFLKAQIRNLKMILAFIHSPEAKKKWLEETLKKQFSN